MKFKLNIRACHRRPGLRLNAINSSIFLFLFSCSFIQVAIAQTSLQEMQGYIQEVARNNNVDIKDVAELRIIDQNISSLSQIENIYFCQQHKGIDIVGSNMSLHLTANKEVIKTNHHFIKDLDEKVNATTPQITAITAIQSAVKHLGLSTKKTLRIIEAESGRDLKGVYNDGGISKFNIRTKLVYANNDESKLSLAWVFNISSLDDQYIWNIKIDAITGAVLNVKNLVDSCAIGHHNHSDKKCDSDQNQIKDATNTNQGLDQESMRMVSGYRVFPVPVEHPDDGVRQLINNPVDPVASPFGWHDTNGIIGAEFTTTKGNNVDANESGNNNGFRPDGGLSLLFDFPYLQNDPDNYEAAAITNLFYLTNTAHDVLYHYGFDEASGNFQEMNYTSNGVGGDYVDAQAQVSTWCNASFATQPEGTVSTLKMYICDDGPEVQDGCMSNVIVFHEYVHGLTRRLVGGPTSICCMENAESMSEGWSDWYALMFTIEDTDTRYDSRFIGPWYFDSPAGARPLPYNTDMAINNHTYNSIAGFGSTHDRGAVWAMMLWEMTWDLIDLYGFDSDLYNGSGGNNIALQIVTEGLKLAPCNPGFQDARDAILTADVQLNDGVNSCLIWSAFAKRGLGFSADQMDPDNANDGVEAYDVTSVCNCPSTLNLTGNIPSSFYEAGSTITSNGTLNSGSSVIFQAGNQVQLNPGFQALQGSDFHAYIASCTMFAPNEDLIYARLSDFAPSKIPTAEESSNQVNRSINIENFPNPFEKRTTFKIDLKNESKVQLSIFDIAGKLIATAIANSILSAGTHFFKYHNKQLPNGIYYYRLSTENGMMTKKMIINK